MINEGLEIGERLMWKSDETHVVLLPWSEISSKILSRIRPAKCGTRKGIILGDICFRGLQDYMTEAENLVTRENKT